MDAALGVIFGILSMLGYGLSNAISQVPAKKVGVTRTVFYRNLLIAPIIFIVLLFFLSSTTVSLTYILIAAGISIIGYIPLATYVKAVKHGKVGVVTPISHSSLLVTVILSLIFFGEKLTALQTIAIALIVLGVMLISINFRDFRKSHIFQLSSGVPFAFISCLLWGLVFFLIKIPANVIGPILTGVILETGVFVSSAVHLKILRKRFSLPPRELWKYIIPMGLLGVLGTVCYTLGLNYINISILAPITFSSPAIIALYGRVFYKEELEIKQYIAVALVVLGIVLIA